MISQEIITEARRIVTTEGAAEAARRDGNQIVANMLFDIADDMELRAFARWGADEVAKAIQIVTGN